MFKFSIFLTLIVLVGCTATDNTIIKPINADWHLRQSSTGDEVEGTVPGNVHYDLLKAGKIPDPFYRDNEDKVQWIEKEDWIYETTFQVDAEILDKDQAKLVFEGIDTYGKVYLNDSLILETDNMYLSWEAEVKEMLKSGSNKLRVFLESPVNKMIPKRDSLGQPLPTINDKTEKTTPLTRKAPYHFGWDWGPRLVTSGIWRPVYIKAWDHATLTDIYITQDHAGENTVKVNFEVEVSALENMKGEVEIQLRRNNWQQTTTVKREFTQGLNKVYAELEVEDPELWYPAGYGDQPLYDVSARLKKGNRLLSEKNLRTGLRKVELVQKDDSVGRSFYFKVNDIPVFAKGANLIPFDNLLNRVTESKYRHVLESAIAANMNMVRVWGGGIYENDIFYEICDELGLLVWQDFMFGNEMYHVDKGFYQSVRHEAVYNVKRLRNHPSIVLWCGDNEGEWLWKRGWNKKYDPELWEQYKRITYHLLDSVVAELDPQRPYWRSSPTSDSDTIPPNHPGYGDVHDWRIHFGKPPYEKYFEWQHRFVSEFGHQSFADWNTILKFTAPTDRVTGFEAENYGQKMKSHVLNVHNKQPWGNQKIELYMEYYYEVPSDFKEYTYLSQISHAEGMKTGVEYFRRSMPVCMGSLYWQLNDCYPVTSWSSIDYFGRWKAFHYYARRFHQNILISPVIHDNMVEVHLVSDSTKDLSAEMELTLVDFDGNELLTVVEDVSVRALGSDRHFYQSVDELLGENRPDEVFLASRLKLGEKIIATNDLFFEKPKNLKLPQAAIQRKIREIEGGYEIELSSDKLARHVGLIFEKRDGFFSDNYFDLHPGVTKTITWTADEGVRIEKGFFDQHLEVLALNNLNQTKK